jgi:hypothetical protein
MFSETGWRWSAARLLRSERVALGAARNRAELGWALYVLAAALKSPVAAAQIV